MKHTIEFNIELMIEEYSHYVFKIINNIIGNTLSYQDKEEAVSDTFYLLWKNQGNINENLKSYLAKIAKNVSYQKLRNNKIYLEFDETLCNIQVNLNDNRTIEEMLQKLSREETELFDLYYIKGFKIKEIAKLKNKSISAIKMKLSRMRKKMKEVFYNVEN